MNKLLVVIPGIAAVTVALYLGGVFDPKESITELTIPKTIKPQVIIRTPPVPVAATPVEAPIKKAIEPIVEAPQDLNNSDSTATAAIINMAFELGPWMVSDEIVRKWVLAIDNLAKGDLITKHQPWSFAMDNFKVDGNDPATLSAINYTRAEPLLDAALSIPPQTLIRYYQNWLPLFEEAYGEQGYEGTFHERFLTLLDRINRVQALPGIPELERKSVMYTYKDSTLEQASDLEKLMWRLGPDNSRRLQAYTRQLQSHL